MHDPGKDGFTLVETMMAMIIMTVALVSLGQLLGLAIVINKNQGREATRATGFAHDKMEEINALDFTDTTTDVTKDYPYPATGKGLVAGGTLPPAAVQTGYYDYLDRSGVRTTTSSKIAFTRQWKITDVSSTLKQITVAVTGTKSFRFGAGAAPVTVSSTLKTQ